MDDVRPSGLAAGDTVLPELGRERRSQMVAIDVEVDESFRLASEANYR